MNIAVIGSREGFNKEEVFEKLWLDLTEFTIDSIITGGARGVDSYAETFAKAYNRRLEVILPINDKDKFSYLLRNVEIITRADYIIAFWNGKSKGTKFTIDYAKARGKGIKIHMKEDLK